VELKKGDQVVIIRGKDKGKKGKIIRVVKDLKKIVVEGVAIAKRHARPSKTSPGGIIEKPLAIFASRAMLVCSRCSSPTRISKKAGTDGKMMRVCKQCNEIMDKV
jgi:large subunit ribosomal protein L24